MVLVGVCAAAKIRENKNRTKSPFLPYTNRVASSFFQCLNAKKREVWAMRQRFPCVRLFYSWNLLLQLFSSHGWVNRSIPSDTSIEKGNKPSALNTTVARSSHTHACPLPSRNISEFLVAMVAPSLSESGSSGRRIALKQSAVAGGGGHAWSSSSSV